MNCLIYLLHFQTVICDPPCVQGACVANDTCNCAEAYEGPRCTEPGNTLIMSKKH